MYALWSVRTSTTPGAMYTTPRLLLAAAVEAEKGLVQIGQMGEREAHTICESAHRYRCPSSKYALLAVLGAPKTSPQPTGTTNVQLSPSAVAALTAPEVSARLWTTHLKPWKPFPQEQDPVHECGARPESWVAAGATSAA